MAQQPQRRPRRSAAQTRELVLETARELFYWQGIHAVGVDTVAAEARVAPTTLYRIFTNKDGLVDAYVSREAAGHREWFEQSLGDADRPAADRLIALFAALSELVRPEICRGCPFQMALAELPLPTLGGREAAIELKQWVRVRFGELARQHVGRRGRAAEMLADQLMLLYDGAFATAASLGGDGPAANLGAIARSLLR